MYICHFLDKLGELLTLDKFIILMTVTDSCQQVSEFLLIELIIFSVCEVFIKNLIENFLHLFLFGVDFGIRDVVLFLELQVLVVDNGVSLEGWVDVCSAQGSRENSQFRKYSNHYLF